MSWFSQIITWLSMMHYKISCQLLCDSLLLSKTCSSKVCVCVCVFVCVNSQTKLAWSVLNVLGTGWEFLINAQPLYKLTVQNMRQFQSNIIIFQVQVAGTQSWESIMYSKQPSMARQSFIHLLYIHQIHIRFNKPTGYRIFH